LKGEKAIKFWGEYIDGTVISVEDNDYEDENGKTRCKWLYRIESLGGGHCAIEEIDIDRIEDLEE